MAERKITNNTILLFLSEDGVTWQSVVCLTKTGRSLQIDEVDASSICGPDKSPGILSGNVTCEAQHLLDPATDKVSGHGLFDWAVNKTTLYWKISPAIPVDGDVISTGQGFISALDDTYQYNTQSTFSATLSIKGIPEETIYVAGITDPTDIADLWLWLDASVGVTGTTTVTAWADQSGNGNNLTSTSGQEPLLSTGQINGLPAVARLTDCRMSTAVVVPDLATQGGTIFIVGKQATSGDANGPFLSFGSSQSVSIRRGGSSANAIRFGVNSSGGATVANFTGVPDGTFYTLRLRVDNVNQYSTINNTSETTVACILGSHAGGTNLELFWQAGPTFGDKAIAEVIIYTRDLTTEEIDNVEAYLLEKYNHY